jgi:hypothetical protein
MSTRQVTLTASGSSSSSSTASFRHQSIFEGTLADAKIPSSLSQTEAHRKALPANPRGIEAYITPSPRLPHLAAVSAVKPRNKTQHLPVSPVLKWPGSDGSCMVRVSLPLCIYRCPCRTGVGTWSAGRRDKALPGTEIISRSVALSMSEGSQDPQVTTRFDLTPFGKQPT